MKCPLCQTEMKTLPDSYGLCLARNIEPTNIGEGGIPALEPKVDLLEAIVVDVDICPDCHHVSLTACTPNLLEPRRRFYEPFAKPRNP